MGDGGVVVFGNVQWQVYVVVGVMYGMVGDQVIGVGQYYFVIGVEVEQVFVEQYLVVQVFGGQCQGYVVDVLQVEVGGVGVVCYEVVVVDVVVFGVLFDQIQQVVVEGVYCWDFLFVGVEQFVVWLVFVCMSVFQCLVGVMYVQCGGV